MFCTQCNTRLDEATLRCPKCGLQHALPSSPPPQPVDIGQNAGMRLLLPVGRSGWAIAAGYLGLLSLLCLPAPLALVCGILAVRDIRRHPEKHGMGRAIFGIVMGSLVLLLMVVGFGVALVQDLSRHR